MTAQTVTILVLAVLGLAYLLKDALGSAFTGGCKSGCGSCASSGCPVKKIEAIGKDLDSTGRRSA